MLTHVSLFAGIGGDTLAAEWAGFQTVCLVEIDLFCQKVLRKHWPSVPIVGDVRNVEEIKQQARVCHPITLITGGFPCQPVSVAGKRRGTADDRWLWPEMFAVIQAIRPTWCVGENVNGIIRLGLDECLSDLEAEGYACQTFVIPACAVNASHRRDRVFIVAHTTSQQEYAAREGRLYSLSSSQNCDAPNPNPARLQEREVFGRDVQQEQQAALRDAWQEDWYEVATRFCRVDDGVPSELDRNRVNRLKALGNAIVPQQIYPILKAIADIEGGEVNE